LLKARISSARQAVVLGPSLTGWGYFPDFTPAKNDDLPMGIIGCIPRLRSPTICHKQTNPVSGKLNGIAMYSTSWVHVAHGYIFILAAQKNQCNGKK
jgi:hypothetical protein